MTKRILAISNHADMLGGGEHSYLDLLSRLKGFWDILAVVPKEGELKTRLERKGIKTQVIPLPSMKPWYAFSIFASLIAYFNLCRRYRPDLIYTNGPRAVFYGGIVGRLLNLPVIWHCRIAGPDIYLDFILRKLSTMIVVNSHATAKRFAPHIQPKVRVVHNGVDLRSLRDDSVPRPGLIGEMWKVVLVVARISRWKRHDLALAAFEQAAIKEPNAHLICVGAKDELEPNWWDYLQNRTHQSKVHDRIHWIGQVEDVRPWYRSASVLLLCSENEPFGRVLVEAMACGVPVIATRGGGVPEIVRHGEDGFLVTPGNSYEIAVSIEKLLNHREIILRFSKSAKQRSLSFSLETHVANMIELINETLQK